MKGYVLHGICDLRYEEVEMPKCKAGWAIVKVKAAGICSSDISRIFIKGAYHYPIILGHEFSGIVVKVGSEADKTLIGKRVGVFPLIPCNECDQCKKKQYQLCSDYDYIGSRRDGAYAEYVAVPVWNLVDLGEHISFVTGAMLEPMAVALHATKLADIQKGQSVAVVGTGMIGICVGLWALSLGVQRVCILGRNERKRNIIESYGLEYIIPSDNDASFDVVIEAVGSGSALETALKTVKSGGTVVLMGNPEGDINLKQDIYWKILRKELTIKGSWNSTYDGMACSDWTSVTTALNEKKIEIENLVSHTYKQNELRNAVDLMFDHKETYCKVMTVWNEE